MNPDLLKRRHFINKQRAIQKLEENFGCAKLESILDEFNTAGRIEALTEKEGRFILRQVSLDALRDRILADAREADISPSAWQIQASFSRLASQSGSSTGHTPSQVKSEITSSQYGKASAGLTDTGRLKIVTTAEELPAGVQLSGIGGAYDSKTGTMYLVAGGIVRMLAMGTEYARQEGGLSEAGASVKTAYAIAEKVAEKS